MKKIIYFFAFIFAFISCQENDVMVKEGVATVNLKIESSDNIIITKAVSPEEDEKYLQNIYVLAVNNSGEIIARKFLPTVNAASSASVTLEDIPTGNTTFYAISNINSSVTNITEEDLNNVTTLEELGKLEFALSNETLERGRSFIMCGSVNFDVTSSQSNNNNNISLQRIDSKIKIGRAHV